MITETWFTGWIPNGNDYVHGYVHHDFPGLAGHWWCLTCIGTLSWKSMKCSKNVSTACFERNLEVSCGWWLENFGGYGGSESVSIDWYRSHWTGVSINPRGANCARSLFTVWFYGMILRYDFTGIDHLQGNYTWFLYSAGFLKYEPGYSLGPRKDNTRWISHTK